MSRRRAKKQHGGHNKGVWRNMRNSKGWRIPAKGTVSRAIYDQLVQGRQPFEIAKTLQIDVGTLRVLSHRFRNPDWRGGRSNG